MNTIINWRNSLALWIHQELLILEVRTLHRWEDSRYKKPWKFLLSIVHWVRKLTTVTDLTNEPIDF